MATMIIDGISTSGRSTLLCGLQRLAHEQAPDCSKIFLTEHMTERHFEGGSPSIDEVHAHAASVLGVVAVLQSMHASGPFHNHDKVLSIVVERLFLTLLSRQLMTKAFFEEQAELVRSLKLRHVFLRIPDDRIEERVACSLEHRNRAWAEYIERLSGVSGAAELFSAQQQEMEAAHDILPSSIETKKSH